MHNSFPYQIHPTSSSGGVSHNHSHHHNNNVSANSDNSVTVNMPAYVSGAAKDEAYGSSNPPPTSSQLSQGGGYMYATTTTTAPPTISARAGFVSTGNPCLNINAGSKLFVGQVPGVCTEEQLRPIFAEFGKLLEVKVMREQSGRSKGSAWVRYEAEDSARRAIEALNEKWVIPPQTNPLRVQFASPPKRTMMISGMSPMTTTTAAAASVPGNTYRPSDPIAPQQTQLAATFSTNAASGGVGVSVGGGGVQGYPAQNHQQQQLYHDFYALNHLQQQQQQQQQSLRLPSSSQQQQQPYLYTNVNPTNTVAAAAPTGYTYVVPSTHNASRQGY